MTLPDRFTTRRMRAERLTADRLPEVLRMHGNADCMRYLGGPRDEHQAAAYLGRNLEHWERHGFGLWILHELNGQQAIGRAVLRHVVVEGVDEVEVGYGFYREFWGRGLATEVTTACLELGRGGLGLRSIVGLTDPDNHASQWVLRKAGLAYEREILHDAVPSVLFRIQWPDETGAG